MTDRSVVKQLEGLLAPIKKDLGVINKKLDQHTKTLEQHDKNFVELGEKVGQNTRALINIEDTIKIYGDIYQVNNDNARKLEKRVDFLEEKNGIVAPPELRLAGVA